MIASSGGLPHRDHLREQINSLSQGREVETSQAGAVGQGARSPGSDSTQPAIAPPHKCTSHLSKKPRLSRQRGPWAGQTPLGPQGLVGGGAGVGVGAQFI